ncbi:MAG TPA: hypothetical protein PKW75_02690 [candidate division Zixibacteria bacterium]|nr:hypothetical protein [candidate division Zixibacteria bacterium]MDD4916275.1 hypothetical protein [candidate division Zixibacteria bacterium]MDM7973656.1 hypothetical protein [candidate division Zixibacteria bacterium]HOZ07171.1 hypothetical protein [candidate division Zixibacteria bacterium]HPM37580.1 hypothetical protein [candidate division Zixibacteria bacterium]
MRNPLRPVAAAAALVLLAALPQAARAQQPALVIGEVTFPSLRWGQQSAQVPVTNSSDYLKFIVAETDIRFTGAYLNPERRIRSYHALPPGESTTIEAAVLVPGNFGQAQVYLRLYDVVDTLDEILPGQKFYEQPFLVTFHVPEGLRPYVDTRVTLPPRVEDHPYFDNEFARLLFLLLGEGKLPAEIAALAECDTGFVSEQLALMVGEGYVGKDSTGFKLKIPVIRAAEADSARSRALVLADSLTDLIAANLPRFAAVRDSLVAAGRVNRDSNAFFDPGTVLYHTYPVVGGLALWWDLGNAFITRSAPLYLYDGTDLCNADIPIYMYAVEGGPVVNGHLFYAPVVSSTSYELYFGDTIPTIACDPDFIRFKSYPIHVNFQPAEEYRPTTYVFDSAVVRPAVEALTYGADSLLAHAYLDLRDMAVDKFGHPRLDYGYRYWFWNLVATRTLEGLVARGAVRRQGNGQFRLTATEFGG